MSYGSPSQWERKAEVDTTVVDTTVPENPIHEKLIRLGETVKELNQGVIWERVKSLTQSVVDQVMDIRKDGWKGRIDLWVYPEVFTQEQLDVLKGPEMGEVNFQKRRIGDGLIENMSRRIREVFRGAPPVIKP